MEGQAEHRVVGRYALFGPIAAGGMATVHYGRLLGPVGFTRTVAIKRMHPHIAGAPELVAAFIDEARLTTRVKHPNVVPVLDVLHADDELWLVMEYVAGASLAELIELGRTREQRVPLRVAASIVCGALHGLHAAHEAKDESGVLLGLVHRDVSPQNILVGSDGVARVADFGIAKASGRVQSTTRAGQVKGKIPYMAPEQVLSEDATRQTDIYAAGVVLWELLAGRRLFTRGNDAALIREILERDIEPPSRYAPDIPDAVDAIVLRALARRPSERFQTAREFALELESAANPMPAWQVGEWVEALALDALTKKQSVISEIERIPLSFYATTPVSSSGRAKTPVMSADLPTISEVPTPALDTLTVVTADGSKRGFRKRLWILAAVAVIAIPLGLFGLLQIARRPHNAAQTPGPSSASAPTATPSVAPAPSSSSVAAPELESAKAATPAKPTSKPLAPSKKKNCDPPYTESNGIRYPKPECI